MTTEYTQNFRLNKPDFRTSPWSSYLNDNADRIDALIYNSLQANGTSVYDNGVAVVVGQIMYDPDLNTFWVNTIAHTTEAAGDFNDDRVENPGAWIVLHFAWTPRGQWAHSTVYSFYDVAYDPNVGITAVCIDPHSSGATGTINDEIDKWVVIADNSEITAALIAFDNTGTSLTATDVQAALVELDDDLTNEVGALQADIDDLGHSNNIAFSNSGSSIVATNVEAAIKELDTRWATDIGLIEWWPTTIVPSKRLKANGASYARATYPILASILIRSGTATFTNGSSTVGMVAHNLSVGDPIKLFTTGGLPTNFTAGTHGLITAGTNYFVKSVIDANSVTLSTTVTGAAVSAGSAGTGTHTWVNAPHGDGDGSTTFTVPNLCGEFIRGWDNGRGVDTGRGFATSQLDAFQGHDVSFNNGGTADGSAMSNSANSPYAIPWRAGSGTPIGAAMFTLIDDGANGTPRQASETRPRNVALMPTIKYAA